MKPTIAIVFFASVAVAQGNLTVSSSAFSDQGAIPKDYSCEGKGSPPPLSWSDVPNGTKTLAVIVDDPDAPKGTFVHWIVYNLPASTRSLSGGGMNLPPQASIGMNSANGSGYTPICPPNGEHHYRFKVYALDTTLGTLGRATQADLDRAMSGHILAQGQLTGRFGKGVMKR